MEKRKGLSRTIKSIDPGATVVVITDKEGKDIPVLEDGAKVSKAS
ncbi:MAG TPA: hypothetical protein VFG09_03990 [Thermodesulfovibrionales bacterium]|nr:hypothetical protein [Thermodesulfovibrionales bacterium]